MHISYFGTSSWLLLAWRRFVLKNLGSLFVKLTFWIQFMERKGKTRFKFTSDVSKWTMMAQVCCCSWCVLSWMHFCRQKQGSHIFCVLNIISWSFPGLSRTKWDKTHDLERSEMIWKRRTNKKGSYAFCQKFIIPLLWQQNTAYPNTKDRIPKTPGRRAWFSVDLEVR